MGDASRVGIRCNCYLVEFISTFTIPALSPTRDASPIRACVSYQIDRLKTDLKPWEELLRREIAL